MESVGGYYKALMQKGILEKVRIKHELHIVWITSDGAKFINKKDAIRHEKSIQPKDIVVQWIDKIKGDNNEQSTEK